MCTAIAAPWAHAALIVAQIELGRSLEAQAEPTELKRLSPHLMARFPITEILARTNAG